MRKGLVVGLMLVFLVLMGVLSIRVVNKPDNATSLRGSAVVGVIEINGVLGGEAASLLTTSAADSNRIMKAIRTAAKRPDVKAVVIRINSPGGTAVAAQEIGIELEKLRKTGKPVVTSMGDVCASGGYWIACSSDYIMANGTTLTGSIGAIMETTNLQGLYDKLGIRQEVFKSGEHKDIGSSSREITPQEREILQAVVSDSYTQFLKQVKQGRKGKIDPRELEDIADGRVFTGETAAQMGLVDSLGNYYDAIKQAQEMAGITEESRIEVLNAEKLWDSLILGTRASRLLPTQNLWQLKY
ncbi:MAG: signal peptide peptidase SppA [Syntrophomonadaceae bacterium]|nr:signal peptide peptidase SppA [Syntrophomonadaceae bacterium]MDD3271681.1 signal peptide peptidase SppA [Syntrophomonadaceae bacterium]MDD3898094.1 signal peptide peptidase SppA [Syntrophomonadaceae bacterium]MDD4561929.1 signal peptide peptidase SppA [Syntrophomonadaceae bacterium]